MKSGEEGSDFWNMVPDELLLRWFNYQLNNAKYPKQITNFTSDIKVS